jgi:anti-sigma regulatory factor (Ser/Thr protein kinase)/predicted transcriptional regulator
MSSPPITLTKDATMAEAKTLMREKKISGIPIVDEEGLLTGFISLENIIIALENNRINDPIEKHMVKEVVYLLDDMGVSTVMDYFMKKYSYHRYPVVDWDHKVVGVVTQGDLMSHLYTRLGNIYMHNKRRDEILMPDKSIPKFETLEQGNTFSFEIDTDDLDEAGIGSTQFKKFLQERDFPSDSIRRTSISLYEAEVNVVLHGGGKGNIKAYLMNDRVFMVVEDSGPGIEDIELAMQLGYSTASDEVRKRGFGAGMGLDNIKKYTDKLIIISSGSGVKIEMVVIAEETEQEEKESN